MDMRQAKRYIKINEKEYATKIMKDTNGEIINGAMVKLNSSHGCLQS